MRAPLVLSLFPGIGLLDRAFEEEGLCIVRGPDLLWGGDVRSFHPPPGVFAGVIGGPPCQRFSPIGNVNHARWGDDSVMPDLIPEFRRVVLEAQPRWWLMENSPRAYAPFDGTHKLTLDTAWLGEQQARRRCFWSSLPLCVDVPALVPMDAGTERTVTSCGSVDHHGSRARDGKRSMADMLRLQGLPLDYLAFSPLTQSGAARAIANGVPLPMGRAIARAVNRALGIDSASEAAQ
jgi:DNA (cytosine-5)-methyltransferase 1